MRDPDRGLIMVRVAEIDRLLMLPEAARAYAMIEGPKSMARLTSANLAAFNQNVERLNDNDFADAILADPFGDEHRDFVQTIQHSAANYFLSAVPLLEHLALHVKNLYPDEAHPTRRQYRLGLDASVNTYDGHVVVVQLRHMVAHRQLPTVRLVRSSQAEKAVAPTIERREILEDRRCGGAVRTLLESLSVDQLSLDGLISDDGYQVLAFADWFFHIQALHHHVEAMPVWRLRDERDQLVRQLRD